MHLQTSQAELNKSKGDPCNIISVINECYSKLSGGEELE